MVKPMNVRFFELTTDLDGKDLSVAWDFEYNPNSGRVRCMECIDPSDMIWCGHIETAVRLSADADGIWSPVGISADPDTEGLPVFEPQMQLAIPMFPTVGMWATVTLTLTSRPGMPMYSVEWDHPTGKDTLFIGHITHGEGRSTIRELLIEFMWAAPDRSVECQAAHHSLRAQREWETIINGPLRTREAWSVYITDWCTYCNLHRGDDSDLVPEAETTGVWS